MAIFCLIFASFIFQRAACSTFQTSKFALRPYYVWKYCWDDALVIQVTLEGIDGVEGWWVNTTGNIFQSLGTAREGVGACDTAALWLHNTRGMASDNRLWQAELGWEGNVDLVIDDLVHHGQAAVSATLLQRWPSQVLDHSAGTAVIISVACDIPGRVALDLFKLVGVPAGVGVPDSGTMHTRHSRPDVGFIGYVA